MFITPKTVNIPLDTKISELGAIIKNYYKNYYKDENCVYEFQFKGLDIIRPYKVTPYIVKHNQSNIPLYKLYSTFVDRPLHIDPIINFEKGDIQFPKSNFNLNIGKTLRLNNTYIEPNNKSILDHHVFCNNMPNVLETAKLSKYDDKIIIPLYQNEALTLNFDNIPNSKESNLTAVKIYLNNRNVITGVNKYFDIGITQNPQNYLICPRQKILDGFKYDNKEINIWKQFTAPEINTRINMNGHETSYPNELKFEIYTVYKNKNLKCYDIKNEKFIDINGMSKYNDHLLFYEEQFTKLEKFDNTLKTYGIGENDELEIIQIQCDGQIFIRGLDDKSVVCPYEKGMSVERLKYYVQVKFGINPKDQRLIFGGKQLEFGKFLTDYKIKPNNTINLTLGLYSSINRTNSFFRSTNTGFIAQYVLSDENININNFNILKHEKLKVSIVNSIQYKLLNIGCMPPSIINILDYIHNELTIFDYNEEGVHKKLHLKILILKFLTFKFSVKNNPLLNILCDDIFDNISSWVYR